MGCAVNLRPALPDFREQGRRDARQLARELARFLDRQLDGLRPDVKVHGRDALVHGDSFRLSLASPSCSPPRLPHAELPSTNCLLIPQLVFLNPHHNATVRGKLIYSKTDYRPEYFREKILLFVFQVAFESVDKPRFRLPVRFPHSICRLEMHTLKRLPVRALRMRAKRRGSPRWGPLNRNNTSPCLALPCPASPRRATPGLAVPRRAQLPSNPCAGQAS